MDFIILPLEFSLGLAIGFFLSDSASGLSTEDIKLSSLLFLLVNGFFFLRHPEFSALVFALLALGWLTICAGFLTGELLRLRLIRQLLNMVHKKDVQLAIAELITAATRFCHQSGEENQRRLLSSYKEAQARLRQLTASSVVLQADKLRKQTQELLEMCEQYYQLAQEIGQEASVARKDKLLASWNEIGDDLSSVSWSTLNHAENNILASIRHLWPNAA